MTSRRGIQADDQGPTKLPSEAEALISGALEGFAADAGFTLRSLYHGESIWFLKRQEDGLVKRIQVSASGDWPFIKLSLTPDALMVDERKGVVRANRSIPQEWIRVLSRSQFGMPGSDPSVIVKEAWNASKALSDVSASMLTLDLPLETARAE